MFAENLKQARMTRGFTLEEVSQKYNEKFGASLTSATLSRYENGKQEPSVSALKSLCNVLGISADYLLGTTNEKIARIPILGEVEPYGVDESEAVANVIGWEEVIMDKNEANEMIGIIAKNANMEPTIKKDDIVIARKNAKVSSGDLVLIGLKGGSVFCRRMLIGTDEEVFFISESAKVAPILYDRKETQQGAFELIGKVVELRRRNFGATQSLQK